LYRISKLEQILNKKYCLLTKSGSTALYLILKILDIKNKYIAVPANVCFEVVIIVILSGNKPLSIDIDKNFNLSFKKLKRIKSKKLAAIIYPYMYGNYGDIFKIKKFANNNKIYFIEDIAPSLGLKFRNFYAGSMSNFSFSSFGTGKIIDMGIGGSINLNSEEFYQRTKYEYSKLKLFSKKLKETDDELNNTYLKIINKKKNKKEFSQKKLNKFKDCLVSQYNFKKNFVKNLNFKISNLSKINDMRNKKANLFEKIIKNPNIKFVKHKKGAVYWRKNALLKKNRDELHQYLISKKIYARKFYPCHSNIFPFVSKKNLNFARKVESKILNFWPGNETSAGEIKIINKFINFFYNKKKISSK